MKSVRTRNNSTSITSFEKSLQHSVQNQRDVSSKFCVRVRLNTEKGVNIFKELSILFQICGPLHGHTVDTK